MSGRPKQGIDYAGWSVDIFDGDKKIDKLLDAKGWKGFGIYFFLCQRAYKVNGYFYEWGYDDCATTARKKLWTTACRWISLIRGYLTSGECLPVEVSNGVSGRYCQNDGIKLYIVNIGF